MSEVYFKHPGHGGRRVVMQGFKLDDGKCKLSCELCRKPCQPHELGTLTVTHKETGDTVKYLVCLECGKKLVE